jgi:zinc transport system permease protein
VDIFTLGFFQNALIGGFLIGLMAPMIGLFVVLRRLSVIGDTLAHISIAGVAFGFLIGVYPLFLGLVFAVIAAFAIEKLRKTFRSYAELSIAIMLSGGIALASVLFTLGRGFNMNVMSYLFGSILTLNSTDLWLVFGVTLIIVLFVLLQYKELFLLTFDEDAASVGGLPTRWLNIILTVMTALVVSVAIKIVGALLVSALLTIPVACSLVIGRGFRATLWIAVLFSEVAVIGGLIISGLWNLASGGTIVLLLIGFLLLTLAIKRGIGR